MDEHDVQTAITKLREVVPGSPEVYQKIEFLCYRTREDGSVQDVTVTILDAGPNSPAGLRYNVSAKAEDGARAFKTIRMSAASRRHSSSVSLWGLSGFPNPETLNMTRSCADEGLIGQPRLEEYGPCIARRRRGVVSDQARLRTGVDP